MNFQLFLFFYFIAVNNPCCLRYFYSILYDITVKWSYGLWGAISGSYDSGSFSGSKEDYRAPDTTEFKEEFVKAWILSNMGLLFVFHLIFFTIYLVVKLLSIVKIKGFS